MDGDTATSTSETELTSPEGQKQILTLADHFSMCQIQGNPETSVNYGTSHADNGQLGLSYIYDSLPVSVLTSLPPEGKVKKNKTNAQSVPSLGFWK